MSVETLDPSTLLCQINSKCFYFFLTLRENILKQEQLSKNFIEGFSYIKPRQSLYTTWIKAHIQQPLFEHWSHETAKEDELTKKLRDKINVVKD